MQIGQESLQAQLQSFLGGFLDRLGPTDRQAFADASAEMTAVRNRAHVLQVGDVAPDFTLPDQHGRQTCLSTLLRYGPVAVMFVRGEWCPFCSLTLRAYQRALPAIHAAGGSLFALTPQPPDSCSIMAERDLLAFSTLSDSGNKVAEQYGVVYDMPQAIRPLYLRLGHDLPRINRVNNWRMPLPATFLVGTDGRIVLADAQSSMQQRLEPADLIDALQSLKADA